MRQRAGKLIVLAVLSLSTAGFLCLPMLPQPALPYTGTAPVGSFSPAVSVAVSPTTAGTPADLMFTLNIPTGHLLPQGVAVILPPAWGVASGAAITDGAEVGLVSGTFTVSNDINLPGICGTTADFSATLFDVATTHHAQYAGVADVEGLADVAVNVVVDQRADSTYQVVVIAGDPTDPVEFGTEMMCAPWSFTLTLRGSAIPTAEAVFTNPASPGTYNIFAVIASEWDADLDGISNGQDNCPLHANPGQADSDLDMIGDACDPQPQSQNLDQDGDTIPNGFDNCPLHPNVDQADADFDDIGDVCDPAWSTPNGARHVLKCDQDVFIDTAGTDTASCANLEDTDTDGDGVGDSIDNCISVPNADQKNTDADPLNNGPNVPGDDITRPNGDALGDACDDDDDNDGLLDVDETTFPVPGCPSASGPLDPLKMDTDGDHLSDGWECANGSDPADPASKFLGSSIADIDGDRVPDLWEMRGYGMTPGTTDTDGDGCHDLVEVASIDGDKAIGIADRLAVARRSLNLWAPEPAQDYVLDIDKNGFVDIADRLFVARAQLLSDWQPKICS